MPAVSPAPGKFKCRWCAYTVLKFRTRADGKVVSGWGPLGRHIELAHPDEAPPRECQDENE